MSNELNCQPIILCYCGVGPLLLEFVKSNIKMICKRCERMLKCEKWESPVKNCQDHKDKGTNYQWKCSLCHHIVTRNSSGSESSTDNVTTSHQNNASLLQLIGAMSEKIELVNKLQLPKISSELAHIKFQSERIIQQNDNIIRKINEMEERKMVEKLTRPNSQYRKRRVCFAKPKPCIKLAENENVPIFLAEKSARYIPRRRSYLLHRIFTILNRKMRTRRL